MGSDILWLRCSGPVQVWSERVLQGTGVVLCFEHERLNRIVQDVYTDMIGTENLQSKPAKMAMWAAASGSAEIFADVALCPFEMVRCSHEIGILLRLVIFVCRPK